MIGRRRGASAHEVFLGTDLLDVAVVAQRLREAGHLVDRVAPKDVTSLAEYDAVVLGSAVYILQWMDEREKAGAG